MPNWCRNQITIRSKDKELLRNLRDDLEDMNGKGLLHYMYPMPHELRNTTKGSNSETNQEFIDKYGHSSKDYYRNIISNGGSYDFADPQF